MRREARVGEAVAVGALVAGQGAWTGAWVLGLGLGAALGGLAWLSAGEAGPGWLRALFSPLRHGLGSVAAGGLGMVLGGWADHTLRGVPTCHDGGGFGLGTVGMIVGCTLACLWICGQELDRSAGRGPWLRALLDPRFHGVVVVTMLTGEEVARASALLVGQMAGHWTLVTGMAAGTALGSVLAGLWVARGRFGSVPHQLRRA